MLDPLPIADAVRVEFGSSPCPYLAEFDSNLEYRVLERMDFENAGHLIRRGWRRHGRYFFRPRCGACHECRSLRVDVRAFRPTRSQRRCRNRNGSVRVVIQSPTMSADHIRLFNAYHLDMHERRGWPNRIEDETEYHEAFLVEAPEFAREFLYFKGRTLVGVGLVDIVQDGLSSVYFFHDPAWRSAGPGTFSLLREIQYAEQSGLPYSYLGYWIAGCPSMSYKSRFAPYEMLADYVDDDVEPTWSISG